MITSTHLLIVVCIVVGCFLLGKWGFKIDDKIEERRKAAGVIAGVLDRYGLTRLAEIFRNYSCGDYSSFIACMMDLGKLFLQDEDAVVKELDSVFDRVFTAKLANPESRAYLQARLNAAQ